MKTKYIILAAALICSTASFAQKTKFNNELNQGLSNSGQQISGTIEEELRDKLMPVLRQVGGVSNLRYYGNTADKSVDFKYKNKDYWYSAEKGSNGVVELLLTRNGRKMYSDDNKKMYNEDYGQLLHSKKISFNNPRDDKQLTFEVDADQKFYDIMKEIVEEI